MGEALSSRGRGGSRAYGGEKGDGQGISRNDRGLFAPRLGLHRYPNYGGAGGDIGGGYGRYYLRYGGGYFSNMLVYRYDYVSLPSTPRYFYSRDSREGGRRSYRGRGASPSGRPFYGFLQDLFVIIRRTFPPLGVLTFLYYVVLLEGEVGGRATGVADTVTITLRWSGS